MANRARVACKACNARRVKCDASDGIPCWHCRTRKDTCELIDSRRGRYVRQSRTDSPRTTKTPKTRASEKHATRQTIQRTPQRCAEASCSQSESLEGSQFSPSQEDGDSVGIQSLNTSSQPSTKVQRPHGGSYDRPARSGTHQNSLTLSFIIETVEHVKEGCLGPFKANDWRNASLQHHSRSQLPLLSLQEALTLHDEPLSNRLIENFFRYFHPASPVVDRQAFMTSYKQGRASALLLQTVYMISFTCGPEELVAEAGFTDRWAARRTHYLRAKTLYDVDYEHDDTDLASALHLLSFWWYGPDDQKDSWYWQGCAVTMAQSLGMHRSLANRDLNPRTKSLWKRIWWSIYVRDKHIAAALGRPCRIREEDCEIEVPTAQDLLFDADSDELSTPPEINPQINYFLEIAKLSVILGDIVVGEFSPRRLPLAQFENESLLQRLEDWHSQMPAILRNGSSDKSRPAPFWASMLDVSYQCSLIFLFRPRKTDFPSPADTGRDLQARIAADAITRNAEDLLSAGTLQCSQIHMVPSLFSALSIYSFGMRQKDAVQRQLAENKSRQCILALGELAGCWPVGMWIVKAFLNLMRRLNNRPPATIREQGPASDGLSGETSASAYPDEPASDNVDPPGHNGNHSTTQEMANGPIVSSQAVNDFLAGFVQQPQMEPEYFPGLADQFIYDSIFLGQMDRSSSLDAV